jgi:hypothetical protein
MPWGGPCAGRVKDAVSVINRLPGWNQADPIFAGRLAPDRAGILGWSMGGAIDFRIRDANHGHLNQWHWWGNDRRLRTRPLTLRAITSFLKKHLQDVDDGFFDVIEAEYPEVYDFVRR